MARFTFELYSPSVFNSCNLRAPPKWQGKKKSSKSGGNGATADVPMSDETPEELKTRGNELVKAADYKTALALLTQALGKEPAEAHLYHSNRSLCALQMSDYNLAIEDANKCIALKPDWAKGHSRLGAALFFAGRPADAAKAYAQGLAIEPTNESLLQGLQTANEELKRQQPAPATTASKGGKAPMGTTNAVDVSDGASPPPPKSEATAPPKGGADQGPVVGIDLGTTYSCVAVCMPGAGRVEVIQNENGSRTTPSWVAFSSVDGTRLVGEAAKNQAAANPSNTVNDAKRLIGRSFHDAGVQADIKHVSYSVAEGADGKPSIALKSSAWEGGGRTFAPEQISAMVLEQLKSDAEAVRAAWPDLLHPAVASPCRHGRGALL